MNVSFTEAEALPEFMPSTQCQNKVSGVSDQENTAKQLRRNGKPHYLRDRAKRLPKYRSFDG